MPHWGNENSGFLRHGSLKGMGDESKDRTDLGGATARSGTLQTVLIQSAPSPFRCAPMPPRGSSDSAPGVSPAPIWPPDPAAGGSLAPIWPPDSAQRHSRTPIQRPIFARKKVIRCKKPLPPPPLRPSAAKAGVEMIPVCRREAEGQRGRRKTERRQPNEEENTRLPMSDILQHRRRDQPRRPKAGRDARQRRGVRRL